MTIANRLKALTALTLFVLASYFFWNLYPVQNYIGRFLQVNPQRGQQVYESLKDDRDSKLLNLLSHGDLAKSSKAALVLADRANPALYDKVVKKMQTETHELNKEIMEHLLGALDLARATKYYYQQMKQYAPSSKDYWRYIGYLVSYKAEGIFDLLMEKAKQPDAWNTPLEHYLARYGDLRALPVLPELKSKIPNDGSKDAWYATREINRAIKKLGEIQSVSESKTVSPGKPAGVRWGEVRKNGPID